MKHICLAPYIMVFLCGLGDALTTFIGLSVGFAESRVLFVPFLAAAVFFAVLVCVDLIPLVVRPDVKELVRAGLVLVALSPIINNLYMLLH